MGRVGRPRGTGALSRWEVDELLAYRRGGWTPYELACHYGISERTVSRYVREAARADLRPDGDKTGQVPE